MGDTDSSLVANLIRNEKIHQIINVMQTSRAQGMRTFDSSIKELINSGVISKEAAFSHLQDKVEING